MPSDKAHDYRHVFEDMEEYSVQSSTTFSGNCTNFQVNETMFKKLKKLHTIKSFLLKQELYHSKKEILEVKNITISTVNILQILSFSLIYLIL